MAKRVVKRVVERETRAGGGERGEVTERAAALVEDPPERVRGFPLGLFGLSLGLFRLPGLLGLALGVGVVLVVRGRRVSVDTRRVLVRVHQPRAQRARTCEQNTPSEILIARTRT